MLHPARDVVVRYQVTGAHGPGDSAQVTIHYASQGRRMRIEPAGRPSYMIVDGVADRMEMVMPSQHVYVEMPYDPQMLMNFKDKDATFTPQGTKTIAGLGCTVYKVDSREHPGQICVTSDGVILRARGQDASHHGSLQAVSVGYSPQPASLFAPPPGFHKLEPAHPPQAGGDGQKH
ncbi:MAG TPA: DUF4412 domain-containing protein [Acetobacteraceae bacterium]|nr:DUF4412 domain-containing protein [Acetobacteraceae bacterium]